MRWRTTSVKPSWGFKASPAWPGWARRWFYARAGSRVSSDSREGDRCLKEDIQLMYGMGLRIVKCDFDAIFAARLAFALVCFNMPGRPQQARRALMGAMSLAIRVASWIKSWSKNR